MKKISVLPLLAWASMFAAEYSWVGRDAENPTDWNTPANWNPEGIPAADDYVAIDGARVTAQGAYLAIPDVLALANGAEVDAAVEVRFAEPHTIRGGKLSTPLLAGQGATIDGVAPCVVLEDAHLVLTTGNFSGGFYQSSGSYVDFTEGKAKAAKVTYIAAATGNPFEYYFGGAAPLIRYNGKAVDKDDFEAYFIVSDNGNGTATISLNPDVAEWKIGAAGVDAARENDGVYTATARIALTARVATPQEVYVYFVHAAQDYGDAFEAWPAAARGEPVTMTATGVAEKEIVLEEGKTYIRAFVQEGDEYIASGAMSVRTALAYQDLVDAGENVYEYVGGANGLGVAGSWNVNGVATDEVPTAGEDIRWFGDSAVLDVNGFEIYAKDYFDGAKIVAGGDTKINADVTFTDSTIRLSTIVVAEAAPALVTLDGSALSTSRDDQWLGVYPPAAYGNADKPFINFKSGRKSSFTFTDNANAPTGKDDAKSKFFDTGRMLFDGERLADETVWEENFNVDIDGKTATIVYNPVASANRINAAGAKNVTASSATLYVTIGKAAEGAKVVLTFNGIEYGLGDAIAGETLEKEFAALEEFATYTYSFAIVLDGEEVDVKSGSFVASSYDYVYANDEWAAGAAPGNVDTADAILIASDYTAVVDWTIANKTVMDAVLVTGTLKGHGPLTLKSARLANGRSNDYVNCPYGWWDLTPPLVDIQTLSGNGTIYRASAYSFYTDKGDDEIAKAFFGGDTPVITVNGEAAKASDFTIDTLGTRTEGAAELRNVAVTHWEEFPANGGAWVVKDGARVRLAQNLKLARLVLEGDATIDLNGYSITLPDNALVLAGGAVVKSGTFSSANGNLPAGFAGKGVVDVAVRGLAIRIR